MPPKYTLLLPLCLATLHAQGPLDPPAGPPAPSMKTAQEIFDEAEAAKTAAQAALAAAQAAGETRTPITSLPFEISQSGSYYFTGNLEFSDQFGDAIDITASSVTIDLNGFTLSSTVTVTGTPIRMLFAGANGLTVKNGFIKGTTVVSDIGNTWTTVPGGFQYGIQVSSDLNRTSNLTISGCRLSAFEMSSAIITDSIAAQNGGSGFNCGGSIIERCISRQNAGDGIANSSLVKSTISEENGVDGIVSNGGSIVHSTASSNAGDGIKVASLLGVVAHSTAILNGGVQIQAAVTDSNSP